MSVDLTGNSSPGRDPNVLDLPAGTWISPSRVGKMQIIATGGGGGGNVIVNDGLGSNIAVAPGDEPVEFTARHFGFASGAVIVDASAGAARITWVG